jgi:methanogenic corrinoid protein MtbC1
MLDSRGIAPRFLSENLEQIGKAVEQHVPASKTIVTEYIDLSRAACVGQSGDEEDAPSADDLAIIERAFVEAILLGQRHAAVSILTEAIRSGHTIPELYVRVIQESLYEVGRRWEKNRITVADEHRATAIVQYAIAQLYPLIPPAVESRGVAVIAGVEGEQHQMGSNLISDALEADGWDVIFLGANTPTSGILQTIEAHRPAVLGISVTMLFNVPRLVQLVEKVRQAHSSVRIVAGGAVVRAAPDLCQELGMDGSAPDVQTAISLCRTFSNGRE